ncbi:L-dopachrome tautomerase yellow-f2-like [Chrysoperla carnea]|uniref:L-dopachrome tautomerase yellow-f2-like n=1 Tax=Chrysoperla carnea TaxID=189513 RepID=UPI001D08CF35|nr:L-dopachrome tautomerase yellow-f2-like [Chrysoperla carnea]
MNLKVIILLNVLTFLKLIQANHHHDHDKANLKDHHHKKSIEPKFAWHQLLFKDLPSDSDDLEEEFIPYNNVPMGVSKWGDKLIITVPRRKPGIPSTLNYIKLKQHSSKHEDNHNIDVPLIPYPNLDVNKLRLTPTPDTLNLVSIYRTTVDECDRLWMVDTGLLEYTRNRTYVRSPRILVLDLNKNEFIHQFEIADELHTPKSTFASIAVDVTPNHCDQTFAYIPDLSANQVVVYDMKNQKAWKVNHDSFHGEPDGGKFDINGLQFQLPDGIFSIALSPHQEAGLRTAYYHALASTNEYSVSTNVLKNQSKFNDNVFIRLGDKGIKQETNCFVMDQKTGVLFYNQVNINALACWNIKKPFNQKNHVQLFNDNDRYIYPSDITSDGHGNIWVMTNKLPFFIFQGLNSTDINFRIWSFRVSDLISHTNCA